MGINTRLENERGQLLEEIVTDPHNLLHRLLPRYDDQSYCCLRFVDWYGNTVFNVLQMELLLAELERIRSTAQAPEEHALLDRIEHLARLCRSKPHRYLKFHGD